MVNPSPYILSIIIKCAEAEMAKHGDTDINKYLKQQARTCKDMIDDKVVREWRLLKLQSFAERMAKVTLQASMSMQAPCVVTRL